MLCPDAIAFLATATVINFAPKVIPLGITVGIQLVRRKTPAIAGGPHS